MCVNFYVASLPFYLQNEFTVKSSRKRNKIEIKILSWGSEQSDDILNTMKMVKDDYLSDEKCSQMLKDADKSNLKDIAARSGSKLIFLPLFNVSQLAGKYLEDFN